MDRSKEQPISLKDSWEIRKDKALTFAGVVTPLIVAVIGGCYNANIKDSENRIRYVELAISQLRAPPSPETAALRAWAVELLNKQSPIALSSDAIEQLKTNALPAALSGSAQGVVLASGSATITGGKATSGN